MQSFQVVWIPPCFHFQCTFSVEHKLEEFGMFQNPLKLKCMHVCSLYIGNVRWDARMCKIFKAEKWMDDDGLPFILSIWLLKTNRVEVEKFCTDCSGSQHNTTCNKLANWTCYRLYAIILWGMMMMRGITATWATVE